jgi:hypothetical protein
MNNRKEFDRIWFVEYKGDDLPIGLKFKGPFATREKARLANKVTRLTKGNKSRVASFVRDPWEKYIWW